MEHVLIKDIAQYADQEVCLKGWVRNIRHSGKLVFIILRDGSSEMQAIAFKPDLDEEVFEKAKRLTMESSVVITGIPKQHPKYEGVYELAVTGLEVNQLSEEYPIGKKEHGPDFLLSNRHLRHYLDSFRREPAISRFV